MSIGDTQSGPGAAFDEPQRSPYIEATEGIRSSARWLVAAFAGVGGALLAGLPLTDITSTDTDSKHFWFALAAVLVALVAIVVMILRVSQVFTSRYPTLSEFSAGEFRASALQQRVLAKVDAQLQETWPELFDPSFDSLQTLHHYLQDGSPEEKIKAQAAARDVLDYINYEYARRTYRGLVRGTLAIGGAVVTACIIVFVLEVALAPAQPPSISEPTPVKLYLKPDNRKVRKKLCSSKTGFGVAVAGRIREPEVVVAATQKCPAARLTIGPRQGVAVPLVKTPGGD